MSNTKEAEGPKIDPIRPTLFGLAAHKYRQFNAYVPGGMKPEDLERPDFWPNVGAQLCEGDEVRAVAEDYSFVAYLIVTFAAGSAVRMKLMHGYELEEVDREALVNQTSDLQIKQRGQQKWCIVRMSTGEVVQQGLANQAKALIALDEYKAALAR